MKERHIDNRIYAVRTALRSKVRNITPTVTQDRIEMWLYTPIFDQVFWSINDRIWDALIERIDA